MASCYKGWFSYILHLSVIASRFRPTESRLNARICSISYQMHGNGKIFWAQHLVGCVSGDILLNFEG